MDNNALLMLTEADRSDFRQLCQLLRALKIGDETAAEQFIIQNPSIVNKTHAELLNNVTPLISSVMPHEKPCSLRLFNKILRKTENINAQCTAGCAAIHYLAAEENQSVLLNALLTLGSERVKVNIQNIQGDTPSHLACDSGSAASLYLLILHKSDVNIPNNKGQTPLHKACFQGNISCVQLLLKAGASVDAKDHNMFTPIHYLAQSKCNDHKTKLQILQTLLEHGANANACDSNNVNAYEMAVYLKKEEDLTNTLLENRVPSLMFRCINTLLQNFHHKDEISSNIEHLPNDILVRINNTIRCQPK